MIICILSLIFNNAYTRIELPGYVIEQRGDYYLVDFSHAFKELGIKADKQVFLVNSNKCLFK